MYKNAHLSHGQFPSSSVTSSIAPYVLGIWDSSMAHTDALSGLYEVVA